MSFKSYVVTYGELPSDVKRTSLKEYEVIDLKQNPNYEFIPGNRYLVIEKAPYDVIVKKIHLGPRREYHGDLVKMDYLVTRGGLIFKFIYLKYQYTDAIWVDKVTYDQLEKNFEAISKKLRGLKIRSGVSKKSGRPWYYYEYQELKDTSEVKEFMDKEDYIKPEPKLQYSKIIRDEVDIINSFDYFTNLPVGTRFGLDYETDGIPFEDKEFRHMGVSIVTESGIGAYFDMDWIQNTSYWSTFCELYKKFLDKHEYEIYVYNVGFEMRATYLLFKKLYNFQEASTINKLEGNVAKLLSLKYTAMKYLGVRSWDDDFDKLNDIIGDEIFKMEKGNYIYSPDNYKSCPAWSEIEKDYPDDLDEFDRLFHQYWGRHYRCIPYKILGKYCTLDSFHTVLLRSKSDEIGYTDVAWNTFSDNMRLGAHLNVCGYYIDTKKRDEYRLVEWNMIAWGRLNVAKLYLRMRLDENNYNLPDIAGFTNILKMGFDPYNSKELLKHALNDEWELGVNEGFLNDIYGDLYYDVRKIIESNGKITNGTFRSRSIFESINKLYSSHYQWDENLQILNVGGEFYSLGASIRDLIQYYKWKENYRICCFYLQQIDIDNPKFDFKDPNGNDINIEQIGDIGLNYYNLNSPPELREFFPNLLARFRQEALRMFRYPMTKKLITEDEYYQHDLGEPEEILFEKDWLTMLDDIGGRFLRDNEEFMNTYFVKEMQVYKKDHNLFKLFYNNPKKAQWKGDIRYQLFDAVGNYSIYKKGCEAIGVKPWSEPMWTDLVMVIYRIADNEYYITKNGPRYFAEPGVKTLIDTKYNEVDVEELSFRGLAKFQICYSVARKYFKSFGSYLDGIMKENNCYTNQFDENLVCTEKWHTSGLLKDYPRFAVIEKKSGRWSAGFHTIPSSDELKRLVTTPPGYLMSYFDISGAEVRTIAYMSQDKFMLEAYSRGEDPYINCAKILTPGHDYEYYKSIRWMYKQLLLGSMYGMGILMIAEKIDSTVEEAQEKYDQMFSILSGVKAYIEKKSQYCIDHHGMCESILGNIMDMSNEPPDRWGRLGINQVIQGFSATALASGFENIVMQSRDTDGLTLMPLSCVHDSYQNYFSIDYLFDINKFYKKNLTGFLYDRFGVSWEFDTFVGSNYYDMIEVGNVDEDTLKLTGDYTSLVKFFNKINNESNLYYRILEGPTEDEFKPEIEKNKIAGFYNKSRNSYYEDDDSEYTFVITRKRG